MRKSRIILTKVEQKCKLCGRDISRSYKLASPICSVCKKEKQKQRKHALRLTVLQHYCNGTPRCMGRNCSVTCEKILELDHINGGGAEHKRQVGRSEAFYTWIITNNFPPILKVLCPNCHKARHKNVRWF